MDTRRELTAGCRGIEVRRLMSDVSIIVSGFSPQISDILLSCLQVSGRWPETAPPGDLQNVNTISVLNHLIF